MNRAARVKNVQTAETVGFIQFPRITLCGPEAHRHILQSGWGNSYAEFKTTTWRLHDFPIYILVLCELLMNHSNWS